MPGRVSKPNSRFHREMISPLGLPSVQKWFPIGYDSFMGLSLLIALAHARDIQLFLVAENWILSLLVHSVRPPRSGTDKH